MSPSHRLSRNRSDGSRRPWNNRNEQSFISSHVARRNILRTNVINDGDKLESSEDEGEDDCLSFCTQDFDDNSIGACLRPLEVPPQYIQTTLTQHDFTEKCPVQSSSISSSFFKQTTLTQCDFFDRDDDIPKRHSLDSKLKKQGYCIDEIEEITEGKKKPPKKSGDSKLKEAKKDESSSKKRTTKSSTTAAPPKKKQKMNSVVTPSTKKKEGKKRCPFCGQFPQQCHEALFGQFSKAHAIDHMKGADARQLTIGNVDGAYRDGYFMAYDVWHFKKHGKKLNTKRPAMTKCMHMTSFHDVVDHFFKRVEVYTNNMINDEINRNDQNQLDAFFDDEAVEDNRFNIR